jgi:2-polyprenyl-3-methyl-5-hydroxy-6-metoxy-1,4-benzoquinol methylase
LCLGRKTLPNEKVTATYWQATHSRPRWRLPSRLNVGTRNVLELMSQYVFPGMHVLEIGCAPGKHLAYLAKVRKAIVCGLDYSPRGIEYSRELFSHLNIPGQFLCEDVRSTTLEGASFDVVFSLGVIEHFDDPRPLVEKHLYLTKAGGTTVIALPNYGGIYGRLENHFAQDLLNLHNTEIMNEKALLDLVPAGSAHDSRAERRGRISPWIVNFEKKWPKFLATVASYGFNAIGLLQPFEIDPLCPMFVLTMKKQAGS